MGRYIKKVDPPHNHEFPTVPSALGKTYENPGRGSIWECDCGTRFIYVGHPDGLWERINDNDTVEDPPWESFIRPRSRRFGLGLLRGSESLDPRY